MSSKEYTPSETIQTFALLEFGLTRYDRCKVIFSDNTYPLTDGGDPSRHCFVEGELLEIGLDDDTHWASIRVTRHAIQLISNEAVAPGYDTFFSAMFAESENFKMAAQEELEFIERYPETFDYQEIPIANEPQIFTIEDMKSCILKPHADQT